MLRSSLDSIRFQLIFTLKSSVRMSCRPNWSHWRGSSFCLACSLNDKLNFTVLVFWFEHCALVKFFDRRLRCRIYWFYHLAGSFLLISIGLMRLTCAIIALRSTICDKFWQFLPRFWGWLGSESMLFWGGWNYHLRWDSLRFNWSYSQVWTSLDIIELVTRIVAWILNIFGIHKISDTILIRLSFTCFQKIHLAQLLKASRTVDDLLKRIWTIWRS